MAAIRAAFHVIVADVVTIAISLRFRVEGEN